MNNISDSSNLHLRKKNYTDIMMERFNQNVLQDLPEPDRDDFEVYQFGVSSQAAPEYSNEAYFELLKQEQRSDFRNYLAPQSSQRGLNKKVMVKESDRDWAARRILDLCKEKGYRYETSFLAVRILDKFLSMICCNSIAQDKLKQYLLVIAVTSTIMSAKLEQPMTPSISRMIKLLSDSEQEYVTKERVMKCEAEILITFDFDFNFVNPWPVLERFTRISGQHNNFKIDQVSIEILKLAVS